MMELNKWYKGNELPDRECDCVVVYRQYTWGRSKLVGIGKVYLTQEGRLYFERKGYFNIPAGSEEIIAYMPIEFPEEVE